MNKTRVPTLTISIQHHTASPSQNNQMRKRNKRHSNQKRSKLSLFTTYMILYGEHTKDVTKKLLNYQ